MMWGVKQKGINISSFPKDETQQKHTAIFKVEVFVHLWLLLS